MSFLFSFFFSSFFDKSLKYLLRSKKKVEEPEKEVKKDPATEAEILAAKQRETMPVEERIKMFKDMLIEKDVSAFSTWEKELHKIVFDSRYLLLESKERKQVFERFVKERAEEERKEKRHRMKQQREEFKKLLEEASLSSKVSFSDFAQKYWKDDRFKNIDKMRDRESLFNDFIADLRKREKEEKAANREKAKIGFLELLKEQTYLVKNSSWSETKDKLRDDPRYKALDSSSTKEELFRSYIGHLGPNCEPADVNVELNVEMSVKDLKEKEKKERMETSLREREKEVARELSTHLKERDKERKEHKHSEAVENFNAVLIDLVKNSDASWRETKKTLKKDHRWELIENLDRDEREKLFNEHIASLNKKKKEKFREMLDEIKDMSLDANWREVRRSVKEDPRYTKFSSSERKCVREFDCYMIDKLNNAKLEFKELLQETKIITFKSRKMIEESEQHLLDIVAILQNDKRYLVLDKFEDERRQLLMSYITELDKTGPPKPITASEPIRRAK